MQFSVLSTLLAAATLFHLSSVSASPISPESSKRQSSIALGEYNLKNVYTGTCMTMWQEVVVGTPVVLAECSGDDSQLWLIVPQETGDQYTLSSLHTFGQYAGFEQLTSAAGWAPGYAMLQTNWDPAYYTFTPATGANTYYIQPQEAGTAFDMYHYDSLQAEAIPIILNEFTLGSSEEWEVVPVQIWT